MKQTFKLRAATTIKSVVILGPPPPCCYTNPGNPPCSSPYNRAGALIPTTRGLIYTGFYCKKDLYELQGDSIQSLQWIKLNETLSWSANWYTVAYPLPTKLEVTCT